MSVLRADLHTGVFDCCFYSVSANSPIGFWVIITCDYPCDRSAVNVSLFKFSASISTSEPFYVSKTNLAPIDNNHSERLATEVTNGYFDSLDYYYMVDSFSISSDFLWG